MRTFTSAKSLVAFAALTIATLSCDASKSGGSSSDVMLRADSILSTTAQRDAAMRSDTGFYLDFQVTKPVDRDPLSRVRLKYPEQLRTADIGGSVTLRFIVDTSGHADTARVMVVSSAHRYFTEAVLAALPAMHWLPAEIQGRKVRQMMQQDFAFALNR